MGLGLGNAEVKRVRSLRRDASARDAEGVFLIEGRRMLEDALRAGIEIESVYVAEGSGASGLSVEVVEVAPRAFASMGDTVTGTDVLAVAVRPGHEQSHPTGFAVVLDSIADPGNVGTLIRSAEAFGADAVWLVGTCADPWSPKVVRASAGAVFLLPVRRVSWDVVAADGRTVIGLTSAGDDQTVELGELADGVQWAAGSPIAVVVGNEARGVSDDAPVSVWATIAQSGRVESLNAAMAGTVAFMHVSRVRRPAMPEKTRRAPGDRE